MAQAQRLPRPKAERMRHFVPGKSTRELWSVWPIANPRPSPEFSTPPPELPCPDGPWGLPGSWNLALSNAEEGNIELGERETPISGQQQEFRTQLRAEAE